MTLIEIIAVLIMLSLLAAIVVPKYIDLDQHAKDRAIDAGIAELNGRETLTWANSKVSDSGWPGDANLFSGMDTNLGSAYIWSNGPTVTGGEIRFDSGPPVIVNRIGSTLSSPASWSR